jgi:hypothetical protein
MQIYNASEIDEISRRIRDDEKRGALIGLCLATVFGVAVGVLIMQVMS